MAAFVFERFELEAEQFGQARARREWQLQAGLRPGLGLSTLYEDDFPSFTSDELFADLQDAQVEDARRKQALTALLAAAALEGKTRANAARAAGLPVRTLVPLDEEKPDEQIPMRAAPHIWQAMAEVPRRHALEEAWRGQLRLELNPTLERWQSELLELRPDWSGFWDGTRGLGLDALARLAEWLLDASAEVYQHALTAYLNHLELPIDDLWPSDMDWAFRAAQFDLDFPTRALMPAMVRTFRGLGVELEEQTAVHLDLAARPAKPPGIHCFAVEAPHEVHVVGRLAGGYLDYQNLLRGLGQAQPSVWVDPTLPFAARALGDESPTLGYGLLMERLSREPGWLAERLEFTSTDDYRVVSNLAWLYRVRRAAAELCHELRLWQTEAGTGGLSGDYADRLSGALRLREFPETYLLPIVGAPWTSFGAALELRAELFAAQLADYLRREFDEDWAHNPRAGRFLIQELWRPGRRHTAEELLGFMGYEGPDPAILWAEIAEVLRTV